MKKIGKIRYLKPTKAEAELIEAERKAFFDDNPLLREKYEEERRPAKGGKK